LEPSSARRRRIAALAALTLAAVAALAAVILQAGPSAPKAAGTGLPAGYTTADVERRTLVEHAQVDGTLGYGSTSDIYDRLAGTFTWLPAVGATIARGGTLFRIDNKPIVLMYGSVPAYRELKSGVVDGPDVAELNANLIAMGFDRGGAIGEADHFSEATAAAVRRWQSAEGLPNTGAVELGRVVFAAGARRVTTVHVTLGEDPPEASPSKEPAAEDRSAEDKSAKEKAATEKAARKQAAKEKRAKEDAARKKSSKPKSDENAAKAPSAKEKEAAQKTGAEKEKSSAPAAPKLTLGTSSTKQVVQLNVKADQQSLAHVGERAPITLPDGRVVKGRITDVGTVATESSEGEKGGGGGNEKEKPSGNGESATVAVTLALDRRVARLDKAPVSVELVKSIRRNVLAVPATALVATAGGGYAIRVLEGSRRSELTVTPGMFANGYVQVEGTGVRAGLSVIEPQ
jgi:peptidoglycan hydrolase-like protein with peptidoglycan-binding domain